MFFVKRAIWLTFLMASLVTVLLATHEFGHLVAAKLVGVRVEAFSVFYAPTIFHITLGGIEWRIGSIPFGAYVTLHSADMKTATTTAKTLILLAGPCTNLLMGIGCFMISAYARGSIKRQLRQCTSMPEFTWYTPIGLMRLLDVRIQHFGLGGFIYDIEQVSFLMFIGNILPIPPLDGGQIVFSIWLDPEPASSNPITIIHVITLLVGLLLIFIGGIYGVIKDIRNWNQLAYWKP